MVTNLKKIKSFLIRTHVYRINYERLFNKIIARSGNY